MIALADEVLDKTATEHEAKDFVTQEVITGPRYHARCKVDDNEIIEVDHSESQVFLDSINSVNPLIYYRMSKPLAKEKELPVFDLTKFYKKAEKVCFDLEFVPDLKA